MAHKEKDKKKLLVLVLLLFTVVGLTGYGVYSYFFTEGDFIGYGSTVEIAAFNPETTIRGTTKFLGSGGSVIITCPDYNGGNNVTCTGSVLVSNNGDRDITVEVLDTKSGKQILNSVNETENVDQDVVVSAPSFNWTTTTIAAGESATLNISVDTELTSNFSSDTAVDAGSGERHIDGRWAIEVSFKLKASQVH